MPFDMNFVLMTFTQKTVGILIGATLPWAIRVSKEHLIHPAIKG
jgi:hypothetical protein